MAQLMPLPPTVSCFSKIQIGFTFLVLTCPGSSRKRAVKRVCARACERVITLMLASTLGPEIETESKCGICDTVLWCSAAVSAAVKRRQQNRVTFKLSSVVVNARALLQAVDELEPLAAVMPADADQRRAYVLLLLIIVPYQVKQRADDHCRQYG